jgi:hypothetical protein
VDWIVFDDARTIKTPLDRSETLLFKVIKRKTERRKKTFIELKWFAFNVHKTVGLERCSILTKIGRRQILYLNARSMENLPFLSEVRYEHNSLAMNSESMLDDYHS